MLEASYIQAEAKPLFGIDRPKTPSRNLHVVGQGEVGAEGGKAGLGMQEQVQ